VTYSDEEILESLVEDRNHPRPKVGGLDPLPLAEDRTSPPWYVWWGIKDMAEGKVWHDPEEE